MGGPRKELTGKTFEYLTVICKDEEESIRRNKSYWKCKCKCGNITSAYAYSLETARVVSCGCKRKVSKKIEKACGLKSHTAWVNMHYRCVNENHPSYMYYGAKGISVCERWNDFDNFYEDMGEPSKDLTLDRIDSDGNYEPGNCRWATAKEQAINRKYFKCTRDNIANAKLLRWAGLGLNQIAKILGVSSGTSYKICKLAEVK